MKPFQPSADRPSIWSGGLVALGIAALVAALLLAILQAAGPGPASGTSYDPVRIGLSAGGQASLTVLASLVFGIPAGWAFNRLRFFGRELAFTLFAVAIIMPGIVAAFAMLAIWGRAGLFSDAVDLLGLSYPGTPFGLHGIVMAHLLLDGPIVTLAVAARLDSVPASRLKVGRSLALSPLTRFATIDWPAIQPVLPAVAALIFLTAFTSFPVVLLLGGGVGNETFETAIYAAVRLDFDLGAAVLLALVQLAIATLIIVPALALGDRVGLIGTKSPLHWPETGLSRLAAIAVLTAAIAYVGAPVLTVLAGLATPELFAVLTRPSFADALRTSLFVATLSAILATAGAVLIANARISTRGALAAAALSAPAYAYLAVPALVLSLGFFLLVRLSGLAPADAGLPVVIAGNALLALPYALALVVPPLQAARTRHARLERSLRLGARQRLLQIELPLAAPALALAFALGFCLSVGDLGIIALFGTSDFATLPWLMNRALGAYRTGDAAIIAALLLTLSAGVFLLLPALARRLFDAAR